MKIGECYQFPDVDELPGFKDEDIYILANVECDRKVALIGLKSGGWVADPIQVDDMHNITQDEFEEICGYDEVVCVEIEIPVKKQQ
jgi:hypothetical protein